MPVLTVGNTQIPYTVRTSSRAGKRQIVVTPGQVEVVVPEGATTAEVEAFVQRRRRWIFDKREEVDARAARIGGNGPSRYVTGAKIPFRGRLMRLTVQQSGGARVEVAYRNGFVVSVPNVLTPAQADAAIQAALESWLRDRLQRDVEELIERYGAKLGIRPRRVRVKAQKHLWGSCGRDQIINLNWHLIFAPKPVLEYAVVHELSHLRHRNHSPEFWEWIGSQLPDYEMCKTWLEENDPLIGFPSPKEKATDSGGPFPCLC